MDLIFKKAMDKSLVKEIFDYNIDAFSDSPDFNWNLSEIEEEIKDGWELYAAYLEEEIIAAVFLKVENDSLLSKNTAIKMNYHGSGYSHQIKEFIEKKAKDKKLQKIYHYCRIDNFRMYSLNESHKYKKTSNKLDDGLIVEWVKQL